MESFSDTPLTGGNASCPTGGSTFSQTPRRHGTDGGRDDAGGGNNESKELPTMRFPSVLEKTTPYDGSGTMGGIIDATGDAHTGGAGSGITPSPPTLCKPPRIRVKSPDSTLNRSGCSSGQRQMKRMKGSMGRLCGFHRSPTKRRLVPLLAVSVSQLLDSRPLSVAVAQFTRCSIYALCWIAAEGHYLRRCRRRVSQLAPASVAHCSAA